MSLPKFGHMYRLTRDPEITISQSGLSICKVGLACSEKYGDKETQLFIDVTAFKGTADALSKVQKGHRIHAYLKLQTDSWVDQTSGQKRSKNVAILDSFEYIEPKSDNQQSAGQHNYQQPQNGGLQAPPQHSGGYQQQRAGGHQSPSDDYIPF